ncbi:hypothetical protein MANY_23920 [Mycolicibacterium anyangense]|uniref:Uncharacterized protein n=1 Tax=Mycolicibacterium anyangense TaxID=1431246 RepID=A0A6N4W8J5_9MYCO|nr:hypothetical protein MANY_23920 [Mycolicibacterium anyangense]
MAAGEAVAEPMVAVAPAATTEAGEGPDRAATRVVGEAEVARRVRLVRQGSTVAAEGLAMAAEVGRPVRPAGDPAMAAEVGRPVRPAEDPAMVAEVGRPVRPAGVRQVRPVRQAEVVVARPARPGWAP